MYDSQVDLSFGFHTLTPEYDVRSTPMDDRELYQSMVDADEAEQAEYLANPINRAQVAAHALIAHFTELLHSAKFRDAEQGARDYLKMLNEQEDCAAEAAELGKDDSEAARALMAYLHTRVLEYETRVAIRAVCQRTLRAAKAARAGTSWGLIIGK